MKTAKTKPVKSVDRELRWVRQAMAAEDVAKVAAADAASAAARAAEAYAAAQHHTKTCRDALNARVDGKRLVVVTDGGAIDWTPAFKPHPHVYTPMRVQS